MHFFFQGPVLSAYVMLHDPRIIQGHNTLSLLQQIIQ